MMVKVQPIYTLDRNYHQGMRFLSLEQIIAVACIGSCFGIIVSYLVQYIRIEGNTIEKVCKSALRVIGAAAIAYLIFMAARAQPNFLAAINIAKRISTMDRYGIR